MEGTPVSEAVVYFVQITIGLLHTARRTVDQQAALAVGLSPVARQNIYELLFAGLAEWASVTFVQTAGSEDAAIVDFLQQKKR
jgi:hypothetical protein